MTSNVERTAMKRWMPLLGDLRDYEGSWLRGDLMAAITVWAIVVPEAIAYASIAGMPPQTGLYAATVPLLLYAVFGSARRVTVGPSAAVAALSFATIAPFAAAGSEDFVALTVLLALIVGVVLVIAGLARMGVIADFLSEPVLKGFIVGVALTIAMGQAGKLFGFETEGDGFFTEVVDLVRQLPDLHTTTLVVGVVSLLALFALERLLPRIPSVLLVVIGSILAVKWLDLVDAGVHVVGEIPSGLPELGIPSVPWSVVLGLIPGAIGVAIVVYGESMALSKTFAARHGERVDADQELIALGAANVGGGLFGAFSVNASNARTAAGDAAGQKTQVSSLIVVGALILTLLFLTPFFTDLPEAALGAIVIHAVARLINLRPISKLRSRNTVDFWAAVATLIGVLTLDVLAGLIIGVLVSLVGLMSRAVSPRILWLGRDPETGLLRKLEVDGAVAMPDISVVYFGAELFFANVGSFRDAVLAEIDERNPRAVVIDAEAITDIDTTAVDEIVKLSHELESKGTLLVFARLETAAAEALEAGGLDIRDRTYGRVERAVEALTNE